MGVKDLAEPTDFRPPATYEGVQYAPTRYRAIRLTREVFPAAGHEDPQFDRLAVDLSVTLCFEPVAEEERGGETSMDGPEEVDFGLWDFREEPYVQPLLIVPPQRIVATIAGAG